MLYKKRLQMFSFNWALILLVAVGGTNAFKIKRTAKDLESQLYEDLLFDYNKVSCMNCVFYEQEVLRPRLLLIIQFCIKFRISFKN